MEYQNKLAEILNGDHRVPDGRENRVVMLTNLSILMGTVQRMGWHAHTGDWDWELILELKDGRKIPTEDERADASYLYGDYLELRGKDNEGKDVSSDDDHFTACTQYDAITHVRVDGYTGAEDHDSPGLEFPIEDVLCVRITQH